MAVSAAQPVRETEVWAVEVGGPLRELLSWRCGRIRLDEWTRQSPVHRVLADSYGRTSHPPTKRRPEDSRFSGGESSPRTRATAPDEAANASELSPELSRRIRILIATEVRLFRDGLVQALKQRADIEVAGTASSYGELIDRVAEVLPDIVLLDAALASKGILVRDIASLAVRAQIVVFAAVDEAQEVLSLAEAGISGLVPRDASVEDLVRILREVTRGEFHCSPRITALFLRRLAVLATEARLPHATASLTAREAEVTALIDAGLANKEIAQRLGIEVATVKNHVHNILEKLQVHRRGEAAAQLRRDRWGPPRGCGLPPGP